MSYMEGFPVVGLPAGMFLIAGSFETKGSSDPDTAQHVGNGWTVARTGTGEYTLTVHRRFRGCVAVLAQLQENAESDVVLKHVGDGFQTGKTTQFHLNTIGGADADLAENANNRIHFFALFLDEVGA